MSALALRPAPADARDPWATRPEVAQTRARALGIAETSAAPGSERWRAWADRVAWAYEAAFDARDAELNDTRFAVAARRRAAKAIAEANACAAGG